MARSNQQPAESVPYCRLPDFGQIDFKAAVSKLNQLEIQSEKNERRFIELIVGGLVGAVLVVIFVQVGLSLFHRWQEQHLIRKAGAYISGGDSNAAALSARRALQINPRSVEATRVMAQIAELSDGHAALEWRRKVCELEPRNTNDALALIRTALRLNDLPTAEKTLNDLEPKANHIAAYHAASGRLAEMKKDIPGAERHWTKANEIETDNTAYQFQLALVQLETNDQSKRESARQVLEHLRADPKQRAAATRTLIIDELARNLSMDRVQLLSSELQNYSEALFSDRLLYLEILKRRRDSKFTNYLDTLKQDSKSNPTDLASLLSWMTNNEMSPEVIEFSKTLPPESLAIWPVPLSLTEAYVKLNDWPALERFAKSTEWAAFDFLRHAYLCRALRSQEKKLAADEEWLAAQRECSTNPRALLSLADITATWGWENETLDLLWTLSKIEDTKLEALQTLYQHYKKLGDTAGLYRTLRRLVEALPSDLALQNNLAQISLLLGTDSERARKVAAEINGKDPRNGAYASTYAFSLYTNGDVGGALEAMDKLSADQLREPSVAAYYGIVLVAAGQREKARQYLRRAAETKLLPEEKALVAKAESTLQ